MAAARKFLVLAFLAGAGTASLAQAQSLRDAGPPSPIPPESYSASQYVDSRGCAYVRAGISGNTTWVPRVSRSREHLCGFQPSLGAPAPDTGPASEQRVATAEPAAPAPEPAEPATPSPQTARTAPEPEAAPTRTAPERRSTAAASRTERVGDPIRTVASNPPTPRVIRIPGRGGIGTLPTTAPEPEPRTAAPEPRRVTLREVCAGRSGILEGYINSRTGQPVDCGGGTAITRVSAPATPDATGAFRASRAEVCARMAETGLQYINQATGRPVRCPARTTTIATVQPPAGPMVAGGPAVPGTPMVAGAPVRIVPAGVTAQVPASEGAPARRQACETGVSEVARQYLGQSGHPARCGPQTQRIGTYAVAPGSGVVTASVSARSTTLSTASSGGLFRQPTPASNPVIAEPVAHRPPAGYEPVWDDGRVNFQRGMVGGTGYGVMASHAMPYNGGGGMTGGTGY